MKKKKICFFTNEATTEKKLAECVDESHVFFESLWNLWVYSLKFCW